MKFKFRFDSVLTVRKHEEELQKQKFANALRTKYHLENQIAEISEVMEKYNNAFENKLPSGRLGIMQHYAHIQDSQQKIWELKNAVNRAEEEVERERLKLIEVNKKTKMLEILEKKERKSFIQEMERVEERQLNEIATQLFNRRN